MGDDRATEQATVYGKVSLGFKRVVLVSDDTLKQAAQIVGRELTYDTREEVIRDAVLKAWERMVPYDHEVDGGVGRDG